MQQAAQNAASGFARQSLNRQALRDVEDDIALNDLRHAVGQKGTEGPALKIPVATPKLDGVRTGFDLNDNWLGPLDRSMPLEEAIEHGLTERDPFWPWRGLHELEDHHPLMQGDSFQQFWEDRGWLPDEVQGWTVPLDKDIHQSISSANGSQPGWWEQNLTQNILEQEAEQGGALLNHEQTQEQAQSLLDEVLQWAKPLEDAAEEAM
jgi:hypothetical protein